MNAILFMLIGLEIVVVSFEVSYVVIGLVTAIMIMVARYGTLYFTATAFRFINQLRPGTLKIMTWDGLRGGISIALALSLPPDPYKNIIVSVTFMIVLFSILVQGFTIEPLIRKLTEKAK